MRLLLDTHALIWWWKDDPVLREEARALLANVANDIFVSAATAWELATKVRKGQLAEMRDRLPDFCDYVESDGFLQLGVTAEHGLRGASLPGAHKDPFDRLIAAQALIEDLTVITCDPAIATFGCKVLW